jgi:hypothetical protein
MLDSFLPGELKEQIFPLLDDLSGDARLERLGRVHPIPEMESSRILEAVAGKGDAWISPWPRAVAVYLMGKSGDPAYETFLSGMGEVRVPLLTETALWALSEISSRRGRGSGRPASRKEEPC